MSTTRPGRQTAADGLAQNGLPIGAQLLAKPLDEATLLRVGGVIEAEAGLLGVRPKGLE